MLKIAKTKLSILTVVSFFLIAIASSPSKKTFDNSVQWLPKDFEPSQTVLLIEKFDLSDKQQRIIEEYMAEKYPYKYEFVSLYTIQNKEDKYADTERYKYALVITGHTYTSEEVNTGKRGPTVTGFDYYFHNRDRNRNYPPTGKNSSYISMTFKPIINTILEKFKK